MQRRRFLQLTTGAVAGGLVPGASALLLQAPGLSLRMMHAQGTVLSLVGGSPAAQEPEARIEMLWENKPGNVGTPGQWVVNGELYRKNSFLPLAEGKRYSLRMMNATAETHSVQLRQHRLRVIRMRQAPVSLPPQNAIVLEPYSVMDAEIVVSA
jgi:hypothetical protein